MPWSRGAFLAVASLAILAAWGAPASAQRTPAPAAQEAAAPDDRCTGTLCDFYYGGSPGQRPPPKPAGPTPVTVPGGGLLGFFSGSRAPGAAPAPAAPTPRAPERGPGADPTVDSASGGVLNAMRGGQTGRCSGTLCDFYYGGAPPAPEPGGAAPTPPAAEAAADGEEPAPPPRARRRRAVEEEKPGCAPSAADPWHCYR